MVEFSHQSCNLVDGKGLAAPMPVLKQFVHVCEERVWDWDYQFPRVDVIAKGYHWKRINDSNPDSNPIFQITIALLSQRNYYRITISLYISHGNWYGIAIGLLSSIYVTYVKIGLLSDYNSFFDLT